MKTVDHCGWLTLPTQCADPVRIDPDGDAYNARFTHDCAHSRDQGINSIRGDARNEQGEAPARLLRLLEVVSCTVIPRSSALVAGSGAGVPVGTIDVVTSSSSSSSSSSSWCPQSSHACRKGVTWGCRRSPRGLCVWLQAADEGAPCLIVVV